MKVVIRAGGVGTRLWPYSREKEPKQVHKLISDKSMVAEAVERVLGLVRKNDIYVTTGINAAPAIKKAIKPYGLKNIIVEPARKDTAAAIGLESIYIYKKNKKAIVASLGSDHQVKNVKKFQSLLRIAEKAIQKYPETLLYLAIEPTRPDIGFGYLKLGKTIDTIKGQKIYKVEQFKEKPKMAMAKKYYKSGNYLWNANMFVWRVDTILGLYQKHMPKMYERLMTIYKAIGTSQEKVVLQREYSKMEKIAVDYAINEKAKNIAALSIDVGWNDIGDWLYLKNELAKKQQDNVIKADHIGIDTKDTLIYEPKGKLVTTIGVSNRVVVDTKDALLICDKDQAPKVKDLVEELKKQKKRKHL